MGKKTKRKLHEAALNFKKQYPRMYDTLQRNCSINAKKIREHEQDK